jgi:hypothetical protein
MLRPLRMTGDREYTVTYSVLGVEREWTIWLTKGMQIHEEYNLRVAVRSAVKFRTEREYKSFKIVSFKKGASHVA